MTDADKDRMVAELRAAIVGLPDADRYIEDPATLPRYLRARDWNVAAATKQLTETLEWRGEYKPMSITCTYCETDPGYHSWRQVGFDREGRAVTYSCCAQGRTSGLVPEDCIMHAVYLLENMVPSLIPGTETYVWVLDFTGITMGSCNPRLAAATNRIMSRHYPERLGYALMINAPWIFNATWVAMKTFVDAKTVAKITFVKDSELRTVLHERFTDELADWMEEEITINRAITQQQIEFWKAPASGHDPRGCASYIKDYINPAIAVSPAHLALANSFGTLAVSEAEKAPEAAEGVAGGKGCVGAALDLETPASFVQKKHVPHPNIIRPPKAKVLV